MADEMTLTRRPGQRPIKTSAEVRWIIEGFVPEEVLDQFRRHTLCVHEDVRRDRYLVFPSCDGTGVKLRQGRLEIKARRGMPARASYPNGVAGWAETWEKWWSMAAVGQALAAEISAEDAHWVVVEKERWLRVYAAAGGGFDVVPVGRRLKAGCLIELTRVSIHGAPWWTIGLEAFGPADRVAGLLQGVAEMYFATERLSQPLGLRGSCSYSGWLGRLEQATGGSGVTTG